MSAFARRVPHVHDGEAEANIRSPSSPNILLHPTPQGTGSAHNWIGTGLAAHGATDTLEGFNDAGDYLYQIVCENDDGDNQEDFFGANGAPMVLSFFAKYSSTAASSGELYFGIADGQGGGTPVAGDYITGHRWTVDYTDFNSGNVWTRFWAWSDDSSPASAWPGAAASTDVRFLFLPNVGDVLNQPILVTGFQINLCNSALLLPWGWGPQERFQRKYKDSDNTNVPEVPLWDTTIANTNAVKITVRA